MGATAVKNKEEAWRYLCVGESVPLPKGFSSEEDAAAVAGLVRAMLAPHRAALRAMAGDASLRLYSCDLDLDHVPMADAQDRAALWRGASGGATRVWIATPEDNIVTKLNTSDGAQIPISVGQFPRQLAVSRDTAYVTNYNSSELTLIDTKSSQVIGEPVRVGVNPFSEVSA